MREKLNHSFVFLEIFTREGGIQSYIKDLFSAYLSLPVHSYQGEVFLLRDSQTTSNPFVSESLRFHYYHSNSVNLSRLRLAAALGQSLITKRPQHFYCGHINLVTLTRLLCQPLGIPYTVLTYGKEVWNPLTPLQRSSLAAAERIWTISRYSRDRLCSANQINPAQVDILPCIVDGDRFTPGPKPPHLISKYGLEGNKVLMTVARLWSGDIYKGVDVTIRALPKILPVYPHLKYLVIGRGDDQPRLAQLAQDLGVGDHVVFAGFVANEELPDHYRVADAYVMPSQEGFGIVYLEAMASGIPVLAGDDDGSADPLQDGRLGWQVPHRDPEAVAKACLEILAGQDPRCQGEWLRQETLAAFSKPSLAIKLEKLLRFQ